MSYATSGRPPRSEPADRPVAVRFEIVLDCSDAYRLAEFWTAALGYVRRGSSGPERPLVDPAGLAPDLVLHEVDEPKIGKNRMHLDLHTADVEAEVERLIALGATRAHDAGSRPRILMADPEGNEFCVRHG